MFFTILSGLLSQKACAYLYENCTWVSKGYTEQLTESGNDFQNKIEEELNTFCNDTCQEDRMEVEFNLTFGWKNRSDELNKILYTSKRDIHPICFYTSMLPQCLLGTKQILLLLLFSK